MDKTLKYKETVKRVLNRYVELDRRQPEEGVEYLLISDDIQGHYLWTSLGWSKGKRNRHVVAHLRVKDEKIWIESDFTEAGIANDLLREDVPQSDIVLAFHEPSMRQYTEFAVV